VVVKGDAQGDWYAQLRLLFYYKKKPFIFIRYYDTARPDGRDDPLAKHGATRLTWFNHPKGPAHGYDVMSVDCIVRRTYIVPDFMRGDGHFHECITKWDRGEAFGWLPNV
jgi:hypothetical protein